MADLSAQTVCRLVRAEEGQLETAPAGEAITIGSYVQMGTAGKWVNVNSGDGTGNVAHGGIALNAAAAANLPVTVALAGAQVDMGNIFTGMNWGASVFVGSADGKLADATAGTNHVCGLVWPLQGETTTAEVYGKGLRILG